MADQDRTIARSAAKVDPALVEFLKTWFPVEVKQKQKDNERSSGSTSTGATMESDDIMV
ncbi:MAG: hypothetical protein Q9171_002727 [Xanthocarpia ochracea]